MSTTLQLQLQLYNSTTTTLRLQLKKYNFKTTTLRLQERETDRERDREREKGLKKLLRFLTFVFYFSKSKTCHIFSAICAIIYGSIYTSKKSQLLAQKFPKTVTATTVKQLQDGRYFDHCS
jgi:hypothetical protein